MAYKTISVSVDAYEALKRAQKQGESFSQQLLRLAKSTKVADIAGILTDKEADEIRRGVEQVRRSFKVRQWQ